MNGYDGAMRLLAAAGALAAAAVALPQAARPSAATPGATPLTIDQLIDIKHPSNPVWSRDSRRIAFTWERAGVANLYVVGAAGGAPPTQVTTDGVPAGYFWSADSQSIEYFRGATLMSIPAGGGPPATVAMIQGRAFAIARDGARVAYISGGAAAARGARGAPGAAGKEGASGPPTEIRVRSLGDGAERVVATMGAPVSSVSWIDDTTLALSAGGGGEIIRHEQTPDYSGAKIIYTITERAPGPAAETWTLPVAGGTPLKYSGGGGGFACRGGNRWLDASHFLIDRESPDFKRRTILLGSTAGGEPVVLHEDVKDKFWSVTGDARAGSQASPDGKHVLFVSDHDGWDHVYVAAVGDATMKVTSGRYEAWRPSWSLDGRRIAFDSNEGPNPGNRQVRVATLGGEISTLTSGRGTNIDPQWSPDGRLLVYQHTDPQSSADLFVVEAKA